MVVKVNWEFAVEDFFLIEEEKKKAGSGERKEAR